MPPLFIIVLVFLRRAGSLGDLNCWENIANLHHFYHLQADLRNRYFLIIQGFIIVFHSSSRFGMTTNCSGIPDNMMALNLFGYQQIKFGNQILSCIISMMIRVTHFIDSFESFSQKYPLAAPITFYFHGNFFVFDSFAFQCCGRFSSWRQDQSPASLWWNDHLDPTSYF